MVWLPAQVRDEVLPGLGHDDEQAIAGALHDGWLLVQGQVPDVPELPDLDEGEAACIRLALSQPGPCLVLMDERAGRSIALECGLTVAGTAAVIGMARQRGLISSVRQVFAELQASDFRISPDVIKTVIRRVGE